jgi:hypothetical protein
MSYSGGLAKNNAILNESELNLSTKAFGLSPLNFDFDIFS